MSGYTLVMVEDDEIDVVFGAEPDNPGAEVMLVMGPRGATGDAASPTITRLAGEDLGGHRAVKIAIDGSALYANPADMDVEAICGVTTGAASDGETVDIQTAGEMTEPGWAWTPGGVIYLAASGVLTQVLPTSGSVFRMGTALGTNTMLVDPRLIAKL